MFIWGGLFGGLRDSAEDLKLENQALETHVKMARQAIFDLGQSKKRLLIAIAGAPASGKSTLAEALVHALNNDAQDCAALVPMDGFHLDNQILDERGLRSRKGAIETFDADGFAALIERLAPGGRDVIYPMFDRSADHAIAGAGCVRSGTRIVVIEGNYLLTDRAPWRDAAAHYDLRILVDVVEQALEERLVQRWLDHGLDKAAAIKRAHENDLVNARFVIENSCDADLVLHHPS